MHSESGTADNNVSTVMMQTMLNPTQMMLMNSIMAAAAPIMTSIVGAGSRTPYQHGKLGHLRSTQLTDKLVKTSRDYGMLLEENGVPFRGIFVINRKQNRPGERQRSARGTQR